LPDVLFASQIASMAENVFFLTVAPGLEDLAVRELKQWLPAVVPVPEHGGVTLTTELVKGLQLNRCLKIPTRILLRLADYGCRDFPKLFKKFSGMPWSEWVPDTTAIDFEVSAHTSRLMIKRRIEETCIDGRRAYLKKKGFNVAKGQTHAAGAVAGEGEEPARATIFVRIKDDVVTVSLDTTGELLHKRGLRTHASEAPLRETIAAALLYEMMAAKKVAGGTIELVDPMTGGGTFLLEAAILNRPLENRSYAFEENSILRARAGAFADAELSCTLAMPFSQLTGLELHEKALLSAQHNVAELQKLGPSMPVQIISHDVFKAEPLPAVETPVTERWLIANPPYGERLSVQGGLSAYYESLFAATEKLARPTLACFLLPAKVRPQSIKTPNGWKLVSERPFSNGGLPVIASLFTRLS
jgi:putative N6-adenine-specific DNA methylase